MSSSQATASVEDIPNNAGVFRRRPWRYEDRYGVDATYLPFRHRKHDPMEVLREMGEFLTTRPEHCQRVSTAQLNRRLDSLKPQYNVPITQFARHFGWWQIDADDQNAVLGNPNYRHGFGRENHITDPERRRSVIQHAIAYSIPYDTLATMFGGYGGKYVRDYAYRNDLPVSEWRRSLPKQTARTWKTLNGWGYSHREIGRVFGTPSSTVSTWIGDYAEDYQVPPRLTPTPEVSD